MKPYCVETGNQRRLAIVPRPRGDDWLKDELDQMKRAGVDMLVSMLEVDEAAALGLSSEAKLCEARGSVFRSFLTVRQVGCANMEIKERLPLLHSHDGGGYVHIPVLAPLQYGVHRVEVDLA